MSNFLIISLTIASSGPLTLLSLSLALASQHQVYCDFCFASFLCTLLYSFLLEVFNSAFLCFGFHLISVHLFTMPLEFFLPFFSVFSEMPFHIQFCQRLSFGLLLSWLQAAFHLMLCSGLSGLFFEYSPLDLCCAPRRGFHA